MNQNPTVPPAPKRPPPKPAKIPAVREIDGTGNRILVDPYGPIRKKQPSNHDFENERTTRPSAPDIAMAVVLHNQQIKVLEKRLDTTEGLVTGLDSKMDEISTLLTTEIHDRKIKEAANHDEQLRYEQKTKRFNVFLSAIPIILSGALAFYTAYHQFPDKPQQQEIVKVIVSDYTEEVEKCRKDMTKNEDFVQCVRNAQLKNTPVFRK